MKLRKFTLSIFFVIALSLSGASKAELLQVSADKTTFLSTDSLEAYKSPNGNEVVGMIYLKGKPGETQISSFVTSCEKDGGYLKYRNADQKMGKEIRWSANGKGVIDAIGITSCSYVGFMKLPK